MEWVSETTTEARACKAAKGWQALASEQGKKGFRGLMQGQKAIGINLDDIQQKANVFVKKGKAKKIEEGFEIELKGYKILSRGELDKKFIIKASAFSEKAKEKIEKAGGSITII